MIDCFDGVFSDRILTNLWEKYRQYPFTYYWKSNKDHSFYHWNHSIIKAGANNIEDIESDFIEKQKEYQSEYLIWSNIKSRNPNYYLLRAYVNAYTHGTDSAPHTDSNRSNEQTFILYLNNEWNPLWCGETVIFNEKKTDIEKSYLPKYNRLITFPSSRLHSARPIHKSCNELRVVLVLKVGIRDKYNDYLKSVGAHKTPHSGRTLIEHLYGTYNILKNDNQPEYICLAGLFHSIYGTNKFKHSCENDRDRIKNLIGVDAENLVWLFCVSPNRPNWDNPGISITDRERQDLQIIESANLREQN